MAEAPPATAAHAAPLATATALAQQQAPAPNSKSCVCCDIPVALYGRLLPCAHAFCLVCSSSMTTCYM